MDTIDERSEAGSKAGRHHDYDTASEASGRHGGDRGDRGDADSGSYGGHRDERGSSHRDERGSSHRDERGSSHRSSSHRESSSSGRGHHRSVPDDIVRDLRSDVRRKGHGSGSHRESGPLHGGLDPDPDRDPGAAPAAPKRARTWQNEPANSLTIQEVWRRCLDPTSWWCVGAATLLALVLVTLALLYFKPSLVLDHSNTPTRGSVDWKKVLAIALGLAALVFGGATFMRFKLLR
jgi:hypothetical protein